MGQITLENLEVYKLSRKLSEIAWEVYESLGWQERKILGDQFVRSTDSVGANVAEGFGRFHYLDKIRFYYNARGSLFESLHWFKLISERKLLKNPSLEKVYKRTYTSLTPKLNAFINQAFKQTKKKL